MELFTVLGKLWRVLLRTVESIAIFMVRIILPPAKKFVKDEVVLITGSGHGLGRELALLFADLGATVVLWDIRKGSCERVAEEIEANGGRAFAYQCDVSDFLEVKEKAKLVQKEVGDVTILINNAGIGYVQPMLSLASQQVKRTFEINVFAHFWTIQQFLPKMLECKKGHLVAVSSAAGIAGVPYMADYTASKHGVLGLMSSLREELYALDKEHCIRLTTICPVTFDSGFVKRPYSRFPTILPVLTVKEVARGALDGILRDKSIVTLPSWIGLFFNWFRIFPESVFLAFQRFVKHHPLPLTKT